MDPLLHCLLPKPILFDIISLSENEERKAWQWTCKLLHLHVKSLKPRGLSFVCRLPSDGTSSENSFAWTPLIFNSNNENLYAVSSAGYTYQIHVGGKVWLRRCKAISSSQSTAPAPVGQGTHLFAICKKVPYISFSICFLCPSITPSVEAEKKAEVMGMCASGSNYYLSSTHGFFTFYDFIGGGFHAIPMDVQCHGPMLYQKGNSRIYIACNNSLCGETPHLCQLNPMVGIQQKLQLSIPLLIRDMKMDESKNSIYCIHHDSNAVTKINLSTMEQDYVSFLTEKSNPIYPSSIALDEDRGFLFILSVREEIYCLTL